MCVHPVCTKSHSKPWGLALSEQPFSSCRPLARPVDSNLTSCDTSASLKVRTSTPAPCGQWTVCMLASWQAELRQAGKCPQDYVGFILNIVCQILLGCMCVCVQEVFFVGQRARLQTVTVNPSCYIFHLLSPPFGQGPKDRHWLNLSLLSRSRSNSRIHSARLPVLAGKTTDNTIW